MTTHFATPPMSAHTPTDSQMSATTCGEEVKAVALFEPRPASVVRAWDEMSAIDREVLLESVRQRRRAQEQKQRLHAEIYNLRNFR